MIHPLPNLEGLVIALEPINVFKSLNDDLQSPERIVQNSKGRGG